MRRLCGVAPAVAGRTRNGGLYNPATDTWRTIPDASFQPRVGVEGARTGTELVLAGGGPGRGIGSGRAAAGVSHSGRA
jgi:hypothetical protein